MHQRSCEKEILDHEDISKKDLGASLDFMAGVNRFLGGRAAVLDYFQKNLKQDAFTVLDLGTGSGDIPFALARWAAKRSKKAEVTAIDVNPFCLEYARRRFAAEGIRYLQHSAFEIEELGKFDYVISSMFFHHLDEDEIVALLKKMAAACRKGFFVNDLYRGWPPYWGAAALGALSGKHIVYNDAKLSVKRAFKESDLERYKELSGLPLRIERRPVYRITMSYRV